MRRGGSERIICARSFCDDLKKFCDQGDCLVEAAGDHFFKEHMLNIYCLLREANPSKPDMYFEMSIMFLRPTKTSVPRKSVYRLRGGGVGGLASSVKEVFLVFSGGLLPENGDVERKRNFWNFMYIFKPFFGFLTLLLPYAV